MQTVLGRRKHNDCIDLGDMARQGDKAIRNTTSRMLITDTNCGNGHMHLPAAVGGSEPEPARVGVEEPCRSG